MRILKIISNCFFVIFALLIVLMMTIGWQSYRIWFQRPSASSETVEFIVEPGESFNQITDNLKNHHLIQNKFWFSFYARISGQARKIKAAKFEIQRGLNYNELLDILVQAEMEEITITIPEGYTLKQIDEMIVSHFQVTPAEWGILTGMASPFETHEFVVMAKKPDNVDLEGYLFPDTYRFFKKATGEEIVKKMIDNSQVRWESLEKNSPEGLTLHEVLTLASIVEKEVARSQDRKMVADIFLRRLKIGMALQADSTVNYVTGKKTPAISLSDREIDSPYNTYKYPGLPPGPICNPGLDAIEAVLAPTPNSFLYFLTTPAGEVIYAKTYNEHVNNKQKYLR